MPTARRASTPPRRRPIEAACTSRSATPAPALLPARLRALGYKTYGLGKWNLGHCNARYLPWARGFRGAVRPGPVSARTGEMSHVTTGGVAEVVADGVLVRRR